MYTNEFKATLLLVRVRPLKPDFLGVPGLADPSGSTPG